MRTGSAVALAIALAASAASGASAAFKVTLGGEGKALLHGRNGLHAADSRSPRVLVRIISPGSDITKRGTVRVLVMNLAAAPFEFGPRDVALVLGDGSSLAKVPLAEFARGSALVAREMGRAASVDRRVKGNLPALAESGAGGPSASALSGYASGPAGNVAAASADRQDRRADVDMLPGGRLMTAIDGVLRPARLAPQEASGGYLVFDIPRDVRSRKADQDLTITVTAGGEKHVFQARLSRQ